MKGGEEVMINIEYRQDPPLDPDQGGDGPVSPGETGGPGSIVMGLMAMLAESQ